VYAVHRSSGSSRATGDSVAAGADLDGGRDVAFPGLLAKRLRAEYDASLDATDVSCSGATSANYLHDVQCGFADPQINYLEGKTSFATVTVGADDLIAWLSKNRECVLDERIADLLRKNRKDCDLYDQVIAPFEAHLSQILDRATAASDLVVVTQ
jgi:GDSL-like Lipase/Acylhydrolase family